ncbi:hypothetical protein QR680_011703 [Steinernema hermaphroditum]|uniref:Peptidase S1 domain-containing protein n=1 Tax=Steinernema hermaphroditum TaxID=289476 RepID=A0AA39I1Q8_9BILA|nr:hypothetical protein QR680_011703 [Steinernema hermaphroditum]
MSITLLVLVAVVATSSAAPFNTSELIYGGQVVNVPYFPFQLILMYDSGKEEAWCGATLISPRYALTAAHCALKFAKEHTTVYGGVYDIKHLENEWSQYSTINNYIIHPHFSGNTTLANNDIALIEAGHYR